MRRVVIICMMILGVALHVTAQSAVFESVRATRDVAPDTNPDASFWREAKPVFTDRGRMGEQHESFRTEIRSRWTKKYLYLLFVCPYETLYLKPNSDTKAETNQLWNWDVAEAFIGSDFENIRRYKEFEISPQGEWVDLDIDLINSKPGGGWEWNSGFVVSARIDAVAKVWYGVMKIPFSALSDQQPDKGREFRINLFRSQGEGDGLVQICWQPSMSRTFHVPEKFGLLRLVGKPE